MDDDEYGDYLLQWGRGLLTAETIDVTALTTAWQHLQWGRGLLTAETTWLATWTMTSTAFNGAAVF